MRALRVIVAGAATAVMVPSAAMASTVSVDPTTGVAMFRSGAGASDVTSDTLSPDNGPPPFMRALPFRDAGEPLKAGAGCLVRVVVWCDALDQDVRLGGGSDRYVGWSFDQITVAGGDGDDQIEANGGGTVASGGAGLDTIAVGSNGASSAYGNGGDDHIRSVPGGRDTTLSGGDGNDLVFGERSWNRLDGGDGDDDVIFRSGSGDVSGGAGADAMLVLDLSPGDAGPRTLSGGAGPDTIVAGVHAADTVTGGSGGDVVDVSGGGDPDAADCGAGADTVYADADDLVARNCEVRSAGPMPSNQAVERALAHLAETFGPID